MYDLLIHGLNCLYIPIAHILFRSGMEQSQTAENAILVSQIDAAILCMPSMLGNYEFLLFARRALTSLKKES